MQSDWGLQCVLGDGIQLHAAMQVLSPMPLAVVTTVRKLHLGVSVAGEWGGEAPGGRSLGLDW